MNTNDFIPMSEGDSIWMHSHAAIPTTTCRVRMAPYFFAEQPSMPNVWWRFWQWLLLGWTWEKIN